MGYKLLIIALTITCAIEAVPLGAEQGAEPASSKEGQAVVTPSAVPAPAAPPAKDAASQPTSQNIYGEVQAVNAAGGTMTVQYYDYDADEEKAIDLMVASGTKIENAPGLADIKKGDWVDATFAAEGQKNTASSVTVEKEEEVPTETMPEGEIKE